MTYCPKCGNKITEETSFCSKCGAPLRIEGTTKEAKDTEYQRQEKHEKTEKHEASFVGPLIGGLILIFLGLALYLRMTLNVGTEMVAAIFLVAVGILIIIGAVYGSSVASRRHPRP